MTPRGTLEQLEFQSFGRRQVTGRFDGGRLTSDAGGLLLREAEQRLNVLSRLARCVTAYRQAGRVEYLDPVGVGYAGGGSEASLPTVLNSTYH